MIGKELGMTAMMWTRTRRGGIAVLLALLALPATSVIRWVYLGCPTGHPTASCSSFLKGRKIVASSDLLLGSISCSTGTDSAALNIEGRRVNINSDEVVIDGAKRVLIPAGCEKLECTFSRGVLDVWADGEMMEQTPR
jgi:hypothetical protein